MQNVIYEYEYMSSQNYFEHKVVIMADQIKARLYVQN